MNGDEVNNALDSLGAHENCLGAMSRLTVLAHALGDLKSVWGLDLMSPDRLSAAKLNAVAESLGDPSKMPIPTPFPIDSAMLAALGQLAFVSASLAALRRTFGVQFQDPNAALELRSKLQGIQGKRTLKMPGLRSGLFGSLAARGRSGSGSNLPQISPANLGRLGILAAASTTMSANLGISMLKPHAGFQIGSISERLQNAGFFEMLRRPGSSTSASSNVAGLGAFASALRAVKLGLGVDLLLPKPGAKEGAMALLEPDSPLALLCEDVASVSTDAGAETAFFGPNLEAQASLLSIVGLTSSSLGVDLSSPEAPLRAQAMLRSFENSGSCAAAQSAPIGAAEIAGLGRLRTQASTMDASQDALGASMLEPPGKAKLEAALQSFASNGGSELVKSVRVPPEMLFALSKLAMLAAA